MKYGNNEKSDNGAIRQFCTFHIADRLFGVDILHVKEVTSEIEFTRIFHAPGEIRGYVNIRGQIHLVGDLRTLLGFGSTKTDTGNRVVLFKPAIGESFGVLVDKIGDVVAVNTADIENLQEEKTAHQKEKSIVSSDFTEGVCKLEKKLLVLLDSEKLFGKVNGLMG